MRPEKFTDLDQKTRRGHEVLSFDPAHILLLNTQVLARVLDLIDALEEVGMTGSVEDLRHNQKMTIVVPLSAKEKADKLDDAQWRWDRNKTKYEKALADPASLEQWEHWSIDQWAKAEGLPAIDWPPTSDGE